MPDKPHVCLIVDNPLRDLEGLVLLGRQLAIQGASVTLVPMYEQGFDVPALRPDLVLVNYTRPNNADLIKSYKRAGILVGVLDTEGIGGKNPDQFAKMVKGAGCTDFVDLYCVWGRAQYDAFLRNDTVSAELLHATGCPRYDFCATPWRAALSKPEMAPGYVLINTNFPTVNPRFSNNSTHEAEAMVQAGFSRDFAHQFITDAGHAYRAVLETSIKLASQFPDVQFVLRPHPFENIASYDQLAKLPNACVIQEGTSIEWINGARMLIHQNCSTAIEAAMLGVEALSLEWFNTPSLRLDVACSVSRSVGSEVDLSDLVTMGLNDRLPAVDAAVGEARDRIIGDLYMSIDGASAQRVTEAVLDKIAAASCGDRRRVPVEQLSTRGRVAEIVRRALGYKASQALRRGYGTSEHEKRRAGKSFGPELVNDVLQRLSTASHDGRHFVASRASGHSRRASRALSGASLQLTELV